MKKRELPLKKKAKLERFDFYYFGKYERITSLYDDEIIETILLLDSKMSLFLLKDKFYSIRKTKTKTKSLFFSSSF